MNRCSIYSLTFALCGACGASLVAGEAPRIGTRRLGPLVDVTLKTGESTKGELISYAEGNLKVKLDNGSIVTQDGAEVVSVRFLGDKPNPVMLNSQATELSIPETERLINYKRRENGIRSPLADKGPVLPLNKEELADCEKLRAKVELHYRALEAEIVGVTSEEAAQTKLTELGRAYFYYGKWNMNEIRILLIKAASTIRNPGVRAKFEDSGFVQFWTSFNEKHEMRMKKMREKALEKTMLDNLEKGLPLDKQAHPKTPASAIKDAL